MDKKVYELLNDQINKELYSAYLYMDFANYYEEEGLTGFANWYMIQAQEERDHALKFRSYLHENGEKVVLFRKLLLSPIRSSLTALLRLKQALSMRST